MQDLASGRSLGAGRGFPLTARHAPGVAAASMASGVGWDSLCANATRRSATANCSLVSPLPSAGFAAFTLFQICKHRHWRHVNSAEIAKQSPCILRWGNLPCVEVTRPHKASTLPDQLLPFC